MNEDRDKGETLEGLADGVRADASRPAGTEAQGLDAYQDSYGRGPAATAGSEPGSIPDEPGGGSLLMGIVGALLGALIGVIPWYLASRYLNFFIGWLGFLVGYAASYGYRLLKGKRSTGVAMAVVIIASCLAFMAADMVSNISALCAKPNWAALAASYGMNPIEFAYRVLTLPDNIKLVLPNLLIGMGIGVLGVFSARPQIVKYTDPQNANRMAAASNPSSATQYAGPDGVYQATAPASMPDSFEVRYPRSSTIIYAAIAIVLLGFGCMMLIGANGEDDYVLSVIFLLPMLLMLWMTINSASRLQVANGHFTSFGLFGRKRDFEINDIGHAHVSGRGAQRRVTLFDRDGRPLAGCQSSMRGFATLMDYITGHRLPLQ